MNNRLTDHSCFRNALAQAWRWVVVGMSSLLLTGCGFKMQGATPLPFNSLHITIPQNSQFGADVRRAIRAVSPDTRLIELNDIVVRPRDMKEDEDVQDKAIQNNIKANQVRKLAQARLEQLGEERQTRIVALNAQGKVEEFELTLKFTFRLVNAKDQIILPATTLTTARSMPFDERVVQAKEGEAATLFRDMQKSLVTRIVRRITAPDITQRWETLSNAKGEEAEEIETVAPVNEPSSVPPMWQNPSLLQPPVSINPQ
jgi:LPS-assembly lipoprotein